MGEEFDRLLTEMAAHFDALVGEVERVIEEFAATTVVRMGGAGTRSSVAH